MESTPNSGTFKSIGYDTGGYPNNTECVVTLSVEEGCQIKIKFDDFDLKMRDRAGLCYDYFQVSVSRLNVWDCQKSRYNIGLFCCSFV